MKRSNFIFLTIILAILIVIGSFYDFDICNALNLGSKNVACILVTSIGELPAFGALAFFATIILVSNFQFIKGTYGRMAVVVAAGLTILGAAFLQGRTFCDYDSWGALQPSLNKWYISFPIGLGLIAPFVVLGVFTTKYKFYCKDQFRITVTVVLAIIASLGIGYILKFVTERPRFSFIQDQCDGNPYMFYPWWQNAGVKSQYLNDPNYSRDWFASFPSGHAICSVSLMFTLPMLSIYFHQLREKSSVLFFAGFGFGALISFFRILQGSHYLTDVAFGMFISIVCYFIANEVIIQQRWLRLRIVKKVKKSE